MMDILNTNNLSNHVFNQINQGILVCDLTGKILLANPYFLHMTGYSKKEVEGKKAQELGIHNEPFEGFQQSTNKQHWQGEVLVLQKNGDVRMQLLEIILINDGNETYFHMYTYRDFHPTTYRDSLTQLPNRRCFQHCMIRTLAMAHTHDKIFAVLYVDLDRFKFVNDTLGHSSGDELLMEAAQRLKSCLRKGDTIARMGGDEFLCLLYNIGDEGDVETVAQHILDVLSLPFFLHGQEIYISASIGISRYPYDGDDSESLITSADEAMYRAKRQGRNNYEWARAEVHAGSFERLILQSSLHKALLQNQLLLYYQPQLDLKHNRIISMEALIRWQHPELGLISPSDFIPLAEESGLILSMGEWVIRTACQQNKEMQQKGYPPIRVAANLSAIQILQQDLPQKVAKILKETGLDAQWLELEITESAIMQDRKKAVTVLKKLREMGIHLSIDDFGTGYSSLTYLTELPVDTLKIDRSFIRDLTLNENNQAVTHAIITLAHDLKLKVVAEGVETDDQLKRIKENACDAIQGFLFSRPIPPEKLRKFINLMGKY
ncbi:EAL domain-containing protein [Neobacillus sp. D3-1R]|uniref:sensor domain-containing protein n=1 Tax=Neobacillus sp. D3-1R TaxID=3445778 RepID=UPI003F9EFBAF